MRNDIFRNAHERFKESLFPDHAETIWAYLKSGNTKSSSYDPYYANGFTTTKQNPLPIKAHVRPLQSNSLIMRELGLVESGAIEILVEDKDVNLLKIACKLRYETTEYSIRNKALGDRFQVTPTPIGFSKVVLFKLGNS